MRTAPQKIFFLLLFVLWAQAGASTLEHTTAKLRMMESPELKKLLQDKFQEAQQVRARTLVRSADDSLQLQESGFVEIEELMAQVLRIAWARPDQDGFRREMTELVQVELSHTNSFQNVVAMIAGQSVAALQLKGVSLPEQETHYTILRNLIAEVRPMISKNASIKRVVEMIRDRGIKLSKELLSHLELSSMRKGQSPSELAKQVLKE